MAYDEDTFVVYHRLTELGKERYEKLLEEEADRILFKHEHPFRYFIDFVSRTLKSLFVR